MKITESAQLPPRPRPLLIVSTLIAVATTYLALRMPAAIRNFQTMFRELGVDPDPGTQWVFRVPGIWWLFAVTSIALLVWIATRSQVTVANRSHMKMALLVTLLLTVLMYGFAAYAIFTPLFRLGATV